MSRQSRHDVSREPLENKSSPAQTTSGLASGTAASCRSTFVLRFILISGSEYPALLLQTLVEFDLEFLSAMCMVKSPDPKRSALDYAFNPSERVCDRQTSARAAIGGRFLGSVLALMDARQSILCTGCCHHCKSTERRERVRGQTWGPRVHNPSNQVLHPKCFTDFEPFKLSQARHVAHCKVRSCYSTGTKIFRFSVCDIHKW